MKQESILKETFQLVACILLTLLALGFISVPPILLGIALHTVHPILGWAAGTLLGIFLLALSSVLFERFSKP